MVIKLKRKSHCRYSDLCLHRMSSQGNLRARSTRQFNRRAPLLFVRGVGLGRPGVIVVIGKGEWNKRSARRNGTILSFQKPFSTQWQQLHRLLLVQ